MKNFLFLVAFLPFFVACQGGAGGDSAKGRIETSLDSISYGMGAFFVKQFKTQGVSLSPESLGAGFSETTAGKGKLDVNGANEAIMAYQTAMGARQGAAFTEADPLPINIDSFSYAIGADFAFNMEQFGIDLPGSFLQAGATDFGTGALLLNEAALEMQLQKLSMLAQERQMAVAQEKAAGNKAEGLAYMEEKAKEEGVVGTGSGLYYKILREGSGDSPTATETVVVHYEGRLIDGTVFDSSYDRGEPAQFQLNRVIPGWTEGVQLMKPGAKFQFYIPSDLAYGDMGSGQLIGPGATLVFDVELLEVK